MSATMLILLTLQLYAMSIETIASWTIHIAQRPEPSHHMKIWRRLNSWPQMQRTLQHASPSWSFSLHISTLASTPGLACRQLRGCICENLSQDCFCLTMMSGFHHENTPVHGLMCNVNVVSSAPGLIIVHGSRKSPHQTVATSVLTSSWNACSRYCQLCAKLPIANSACIQTNAALFRVTL